MKGSIPPHTWWGKLRRSKEGFVEAWHPLEDHCADVAACALELLELPLWNQRLSALGGLEALDSVQKARLAAITALHDLGKYSQGFQNKSLVREENSGPTFITGHVSEFFSLFSNQLVAAPALREALNLPVYEGWCEQGEQGFVELLFAAAAHHGTPKMGERKGPPGKGWKATPHHDPFTGVSKLVGKLAHWFPEAFAAASESVLPGQAPFQHCFAGLVMLADWIGSGFPYREAGNPEDRWPLAREYARDALRKMGLDTGPARSSLSRGWPGFAELFELPAGAAGTPATPREAQQAVIAAEVPDRPSIEILEAETGSGKTEAALYRFLQLFAAGKVDGLYFALPTRTAAIQLEQRIRRAVQRAFPEVVRPAVTLAVPGYLQVDGLMGQRLPEFQTLWPDHDRFRFRGWAAENPKRFLVGSIVIGTIDQVLLSALAVPHSHLRATALLRHYLVVDEVHASDAYMTRILREVLRHHLAAGGHALLMSATLGAVARDELLRPLARGALTPPTLEEARSAPYPLVSRTVGEAMTAVNEPGLPKAVRVELSPWSGAPEEIADAALNAARAGARVAILRNTVRDAVRVQEAVEARARALGCEDLLFRVKKVATLHHARFSKPDREALDEEVQRHFGKGAGGAPCVVVATQTIQQSLDIDLDWLLTDLCPMDVLLQRIGRLHRHPVRNASRPDAFKSARVKVLVPEKRDLSGAINKVGGAGGPHGFGRVYEDLRILEATWQLLEANPVLEIPSRNRELVELSTHPEALAQAVEIAAAREPSTADKWSAHTSTVIGRTHGHKGLAALNCMPWNKSFGSADLVFESRELSTRLGEADRMVEFESPLPTGPFGVAVQRLTIPSHLAEGEGDPDGRWDPVDDGGFSFRMGSKAYRYDRWGLRVV